MLPRSPRSVLAVACIGALAVPAGTAVAQSPGKPPKIRTRTAKVQIDVSGHVEVRQRHDTASDCNPGEFWTQVNRFDFDTGRFVNVLLRRVSGEGIEPVVTSPFSAATGRAVTEGEIRDYRTTNYCQGAPGEVRPAPKCVKNEGKLQISLQEAPLPKLDDDDLAPITSAPLMIAVSRKGGGNQATECLGRGADRLKGAPETSAVTTSLGPGVSEVVPSGISVLKLFMIRKGQTYRRAAIVSGPCTNPTVRTVSGSGSSPSLGNLNADGDCQLAGIVRIKIRPRP